MALFGKKDEGGLLDVIRCDEESYLIWKWRPSGEANSTNKENSIRWGSSLRVKDGEVAVFVYKQADGVTQEFIEGPFDETIKTANFPIISNIIGLAFAGKSPFQAEVYFINLAGNQKLPFGVPYFDVSDSRFLDFPVKMSARGSMIFNITDYRGFIKLHRLINFDLIKFNNLVRDSVIKYVKSVIVNAPIDHGMPVLQIERKLLEINDLIAPRIKKAFEEDFGVNLARFDLETIEVNKDTQEYKELRRVTADLQANLLEKQNEVNMQNLQDTQSINAENMSQTLRIQREQAELFQRLQTETQHLSAHQVDKQADVLMAAANNLGQMGSMGSGGIGGGGGMNPAGVMMAMGVGGAMGSQMANMTNISGQGIQQQMMAPPPMPQVQYNVSIDGQSLGPFNMSQLQGMVAQGQLTPSTHVWKAGMANWDVASNIAELGPFFAAPPPPPPPPSGS
jgi:membrane protease subunit (stomatin/prohibitin family)